MAHTERTTLIQDFDVDANGRIRRPGKFEGEMLYVPYFWDMGLSGCADRDNGRVFGFDITWGDRALFPELPKRKRTIKLMETDAGFVCEV